MRVHNHGTHAVFIKETNPWEINSILQLGPDVENVTIKEGLYQGDRDTHDYSQKKEHTCGAHVWEYGIELKGAENIIIDGVKLEKFNATMT